MSWISTMDGPRHIWWNFVSSRRERIEQAKAEWKAGRFDTVPGDAEEFIPLPRSELMKNWHLARDRKPLRKINPLE